MDGSRWDRWPYWVIAIALILVGSGTRLFPSLGPDARTVAAIVGLPLVILGVVLCGWPWLHRERKKQAEEIRRNPTGKTVPLDDRLAGMDRPRARWAGALVMALVFTLATAWAIYMAATTKAGAFIGFAIYLFIPVPLFAWLTWRARALLRRRS